MLFDLRGRGRRRTVQAIYLSLAILMGGGLVLFGVGGATSGGLLDAFREDQQTNNNVLQDRLDKAEKKVKASPLDAAAWKEVARLRFQNADYDQGSGAFTENGRKDLAGAEQAWNRYLKLTEKPDPTVATLMVQAFSDRGLNKPDRAVQALEIVIDDQGSEATPALYVQLAALAFQAKQTRKGDLAAKKAIALAPKDDREQIKAQVQAARDAASLPVDAGSVGTQPSS
ncbi:MAG: hypothetical protein HZB46_04170 [Solirubrobacterales bacterium]|nr:hypothetical protein [Solirubrobacterales bacterium]